MRSCVRRRWNWKKASELHFLEQACGGDEELRREVESLLKFEKPGDRFIEQPALEVAAKMIAHDKPESLIGQQLGSYQILSLLGAGAGMGFVLDQARDTRLKRSCGDQGIAFREDERPRA